MSTAGKIVGVILAGGQGTRMFPGSPEGGEKAFADLGGRPLIAHVAGRLSPQVSTTIVSANGAPSPYAPFGAAVVADVAGASKGPLAGILAAMAWTRHNVTDAIALVSVTVDVPFLPSDLVHQLREGGSDSFAIAVSGGRRHPTIGLWPIGLHNTIAAALDSNQLGVNNFALRNSAIEVSFPFGNTQSSGVDPFFNANTPEDLETARALLTGISR